MNARTNLNLYLSAVLVVMLFLVACQPQQPGLAVAAGLEPVEAIDDDTVETDEVVQVLDAELGSMHRKSGGFSGDDSYDPAAEWKIASDEEIKALAEEHDLSQISGSFSADDVYDPAANLTIEIPLDEHNFTQPGGANYSGDDDYDPAAGGEL